MESPEIPAAARVKRRFQWEELDCGSVAYHAALFAVEYAAPYQMPMHRHDFFEVMYVLAGEGEHLILEGDGRRRAVPLVAGDLIYLRPDDCHGIATAGSRLHWINIAFPAAAWRAFRDAAALETALWDEAAELRAVRLAGPEHPATCTALFETALCRFQEHRAGGTAFPPDALDLCQFLAGAVLLLRSPQENLPRMPDAGLSDGPPWLQRACRAVQQDPALPLERFVEIAGVGQTHLARTLKAVTGKTPTQYLNDLRVARAALLLTTTTQTILDIAADCGFEQISYFYRLFQRRYGYAPDAYRRAARRPLSP